MTLQQSEEHTLKNILSALQELRSCWKSLTEDSMDNILQGMAYELKGLLEDRETEA